MDFGSFVKLNGDQWSWFLSRAGFGNEKISEYMQRIPNIIDDLEEEISVLTKTVIKLENQNVNLKEVYDKINKGKIMDFKARITQQEKRIEWLERELKNLN